MGSLVALAFAALIVAPGDWRQETFQFPLPFAPGIALEGAEHVRFAPSWARFADEDGFSYVFLWDVKAKPVTTEDLEDHLEAYFSGLMKGVAPGRNLEAPATPTSAALHPMTQVPGWTRAHGAEVRTWNAFSKAEPLVLYGEVAHRECAGGRMQVFFAFSRAKRDRAIWQGLRKAREATQCPPAGS